MEINGREFQLTGSRFFGTSNMNSDVDVFAQDSEEIRFWLSENGFQQEQHKIHPKANTIAVFRKDDIHVQLVRDAKLKSRIQCAMKKFGLAPLLRNKQLARQLWMFAHSLTEGDF